MEPTDSTLCGDSVFVNEILIILKGLRRAVKAADAKVE